jgi:hypothetical protein
MFDPARLDREVEVALHRLHRLFAKCQRRCEGPEERDAVFVIGGCFDGQGHECVIQSSPQDAGTDSEWDGNGCDSRSQILCSLSVSDIMDPQFALRVRNGDASVAQRLGQAEK